MYRILRAWPIAVAFLGCADPIQAPNIVSISIDPPAVLSGGEVRLRSSSFRDLELYPVRGNDGFFSVPNRWSNLVLTVGEDTVDVWRENDSTLVADLPPLYSGHYEISLALDDAVVPSLWVDVIGVPHRPVSLYHPDDRWLLIQDIVPLRAGLALGYHQRGPAFVDLRTGLVSLIPGLEWGNVYSGMTGPGQSYLPGEFILDLRDSTHRTSGWRVLPRVENTSLSSCYGGGSYSYVVSQIGPGKCITMRDSDYRGVVFADSSTRLTEPNPGLAGGRLVSSPGGEWTVPIGRLDDYGNRSEMHRWPVFNSVPAIAYTVNRYDRVIGAAFAGDGDTLYLAVDTDWQRWESSWRVDALNTADGRIIASQTIERRELLAVALDPVFPWVYVAGRDSTWHHTLDILERGTLRLLGSIQSPITWTGQYGVLVSGGSAGTVHLWVSAYSDWSWVMEFELPPTLIDGGGA